MSQRNPVESIVPAATRPLPRVAVVVPAYRVTRHVLGVLAAMHAALWRVYGVDDARTDGPGDLVQRE